MRAYGYWADIIQAALMLPASMDAQLAEILGRNIQAALMLRVWGCAVCVVLCCRLAAVIRCTVGSSACVRVTDWSHVVSQALLSVQISEIFSSALCAAYFVKYFGKSTSAPTHHIRLLGSELLLTKVWVWIRDSFRRHEERRFCDLRPTLLCIGCIFVYL